MDKRELEKLTRIEGVELDIDGRLGDIRTDFLREKELTHELVAGYLRVAYSRGYINALEEGSTGRLMTDHGYAAPKARR